MKANILNLKNKIKSLVEEQKVNKLNMKDTYLPENFKRTKECWRATMDAQSLGYKLRCAYMAYAILRGKDDGFIAGIDRDWETIKDSYPTRQYLSAYEKESTGNVSEAA